MFSNWIMLFLPTIFYNIFSQHFFSLCLFSYYYYFSCVKLPSLPQKILWEIVVEIALLFQIKPYMLGKSLYTCFGAYVGDVGWIVYCFCYFVYGDIPVLFVFIFYLCFFCLLFYVTLFTGGVLADQWRRTRVFSLSRNLYYF